MMNKKELENRIIEVIKTIYDPEIPVNIYELGLIYDVNVNDENMVKILMTLTTPNCPVAESLPQEVKDKVKSLDQVSDVELEMTFDPPWNKELMIENFLEEGGVLIESKFREKLNSFNWSIYSNNYVAVYCSKEILVPKWAELLFINYLSPYVKDVVIGNLDDLEKFLFTRKLLKFDAKKYKDKTVMIKGCSNKPVPQQAMGMVISMLLPYVKKLSYGEACSSVPLFKKQL